MKRFKYFKLPLVLFALSLISCQQKNTDELTIATAANMQFAMKALVKEFTQKTNIECELVISSSGKLTAQIIEGAPYDVFVAANMKYPEAVYKKGFAANPPKVYAQGNLVLWSTSDSVTVSLSALTVANIKHIALANPKTAPYGVAALEVINHNQLFDSIKDKLVYGESIAQTNQFITSQSAQIGFTSMSTVLSPQMINKGKWIELDNSIYSPIEQGAVIIKHNGKDGANAQNFYNFLFSKEAQRVLKEYGYSVNE